MQGSKFLSVTGFASCLVLSGIAGAVPVICAAAELATVLGNGLAVYSRPGDTRTPVGHLSQGLEVLTRIKLTDSRGMEWCDVLNKADEKVLGYVRCDTLKVLGPEQPADWREVSVPEEITSSGSASQKPSAQPAAGSAGQQFRAKPQDRPPQ